MKTIWRVRMILLLVALALLIGIFGARYAGGLEGRLRRGVGPFDTVTLTQEQNGRV